MASQTASGPAGDAQDWARSMIAMQRAALDLGMAAIERPGAVPVVAGMTDAATLARTRTFLEEGLGIWERFLMPHAASDQAPPIAPAAKEKDKRFAAAAWRDHPGFDLIRRSYDLVADHLMRAVDAAELPDTAAREQLRFSTKAMIDAISPSNFPLTNPEVLEQVIATRGDNLVRGLQHFLADVAKGQLTHVADGAFALGRNLATTPGKVVHRTALYELIQYAPATDDALAVPIVIFPPWINRFYILDLTPEKSFIRWAVDRGMTVFMVSWKSADATMADIVWDDYIAAQRDAIDTVRAVLDVPAVHAIGYCVAGTTLAATLAVMAAEDQSDRVASATFFTAQVDFADAGDLKLFVTDEQLSLVRSLSSEGFLDGRYMAATFNALRGRDLIWNYVVNNYLLGKDYAAFDLLHWNGDTTNLPGKWHLSYLTDLYRDNRLVEPGALSAGGTPIDLGRVRTPTYVQAGREDHIAPAASVWKITEHFAGPVRFVLAGSGHIAGVVNPPAAGKYQYWTSDAPAASFEDFVAAAGETRGSWWPDWDAWIRQRDNHRVTADGARIPGEGKLPALEDAPGTYVTLR